MDWWDDIDDRSQDKVKAVKLANALSKQPGTRAEKVEFLERHMALMEAEADREGAVDTRKRRGVMVSLAFRYWRHYLARDVGRVSKPIDQNKNRRQKDEAIASWSAEKREEFFQRHTDERERWDHKRSLM